MQCTVYSVLNIVMDKYAENTDFKAPRINTEH